MDSLLKLLDQSAVHILLRVQRYSKQLRTGNSIAQLDWRCILFHSSENNKNYLPERSQQIQRLLDAFKDDLQLHSFRQAISYADGPVSFLLSQIKPSLPARLKEDFKSSTPSLTNLQARLMNAINALTKLQKRKNQQTTIYSIEDCNIQINGVHKGREISFD